MVDLTTGQSGSMTASIANGFGHILYTAELRHVQGGAVRVPPGVLDREPAREHVVDPHLQRRDVRRDRAFRELPGDRRQQQLHRSRQPGRRRPRRGRREQLLCPGHRLDAGDDRRVLLRRRGLGRAVLPATTGPAPTPTRSWTGCCTRRRCGSPVRSPTTAGSTTRRWRSRPTCRPSRAKARRTTRRSATRTPAPTA